MTAQEYLNRGAESFNREDWEQAIADFTGAIRLDPELVTAKSNLSAAYFNRGVACFKKGGIDQAIADITKAISLNPNEASLYGTRGYIHEQKGDHDGVIRDFTELIRLDPTNADAYRSRASGYHGKSKEYLVAGDENNYFRYLDLGIADLNTALRMNHPHAGLVRQMLEHATREKTARRNV
jgi:tetratricopeptide (TPR) repeat protein